MAKNKKSNVSTNNNEQENNTNEQEQNMENNNETKQEQNMENNNETKQETTNMENNENKQETTNMENNENKQETTNMENNENEQENNTQGSTTMNAKIVSQIAELLYGIDVNYDKYNTMQHDIADMSGIIATISNPTIKNAMISERDKMQKLADIEHNNAFIASVRDVMNAVSVRMGITFTAKNTQKSTSAKTATNSDKYSYLDAIIDNITEEWISPNELAKRIQTAGRLEQANSNPRFAGALANTLKTAVQAGHLDYDETNHKYRSHVVTLSNVAD